MEMTRTRMEMTRQEFSVFTEAAIEDALQLAEKHVGKSASRNITFKWLGSKDEPLAGVPESKSDEPLVTQQ